MGSRHLFAFVVLAVAGLTAFALQHLVADVSYAALLAEVAALPAGALVAAVGLTALSFAALTVYDWQAMRLIGRRLPYRITALAGFCAYAVGNVAGFGALTGGSIRYRFYTPLGLTPEEVARVVGYVTLAFTIGLSVVAAGGALLAADGVAALAGLPPAGLRIGAVALLAAAAVAVALPATGRRSATVLGRTFALPTSGGILLQLAATAVDVAAAAGVLYVLLPEGAPTFPTFLAVYAVAIGLGVLSHVPGGIGVFETVVIGALAPAVPAEGVLGALVVYRVVYYVVPLAVALLAITLTEIRRAAAGNPMVVRAVSGTLPLVLGTAALVAGAMGMISGVTPPRDDILTALELALPLPVVEAAHFLAGIVGVVMVVVARGLVHRLDGAWWLAVTLSAFSILLAAAKGLAFGEMVVHAGLLAALLSTRRLFDRPASLIHDRLSETWWLTVGTLLIAMLAILFFAYREVDYSHDLWWQFEFQATAPRSLRAALATALAAAAIAAFLLTRPPSGRPDRPTAEEIARAVAIVETQPQADANLVRMGDKSLMFSDDGRAFVMYGKRGRSWVALFDPVGDPAAWPGLVWRFVETARTHGGRAVFYQVAPENLALYADAGLSAFKLGEEARIPLAAFDLKGSRRASLRNAINRIEREGCRFEIVPAAGVPALLDELEAVSEAWLAQHEVREKGFSLGAFDRAYVAAQPVALLRNAGRVVAFATLMTTDLRDEATVDLMRFDPASPNGAMEVLFARIMLHYKEAGYAWFSLGMAPLAGLSENPMAPIWHRVGRTVFDHGAAFYNFHGLRSFKAKFDPVWRPRYMAVAGGLNPVLALADVTVLISGGLKGAIAK